MFGFLMNFMLVASVVGEVLGVVGTTQAIAEIFLTKASVNTEGGDAVTPESIEGGAITLEDLKFRYPTK